MTGSGDTDGGRATDRPAVDRARIDAVFGETLPETTADEACGRGSSIDDNWWREQRPPHHS